MGLSLAGYDPISLLDMGMFFAGYGGVPLMGMGMFFFMDMGLSIC